MLSKPSIGQTITITTQHKDIHYLSQTGTRDVTYSNVIVMPPEKRFGPFDIKISSDTPLMPFRVINMRNVIKLDGVINNKLVEKTHEIVDILGSKGQKYHVTINNKEAVSCTCPGFTYRKYCRHLKEAVKTVDK